MKLKVGTIEQLTKLTPPPNKGFIIKREPSFIIPNIEHTLTTDSDGFTAIITCRLYGIDCPEYGQPYHAQARDYLDCLLLTKPITLHIKTIDKYGRAIVLAISGNQDISYLMAERGWTWALSHEYTTVCYDAKRLGIGLWKDKNPEAPWDYRKRIGVMPRNKEKH
jgi:endonuclease YncB( thermonuclease family)